MIQVLVFQVLFKAHKLFFFFPSKPFELFLIFLITSAADVLSYY